MLEIEKKCGNCKFYKPSNDPKYFGSRGTCDEIYKATKTLHGEADESDRQVRFIYVCMSWEPKS